MFTVVSNSCGKFGGEDVGMGDGVETLGGWLRGIGVLVIGS